MTKDTTSRQGHIVLGQDLRELTGCKLADLEDALLSNVVVSGFKVSMLGILRRADIMVRQFESRREAFLPNRRIHRMINELTTGN